jgi:hypothetical protein
MDYQQLIEQLKGIYNSPKPKSYQDFEKLYCNIMIYKIDIKANVSKLLFDNYKKNVDNLMFEILFYENDNANANDNVNDNDNVNNNDNVNETTSNFFIMLKEIIEYLKSNFKFDEDLFISSLLNSYYENNDDDDNDENDDENDKLLKFIETFILNYTTNNSTDYNIFLINKYSNINGAIDLYKKYYNVNLNFKETKTNYDDLSLIVLFHNFYEKILKIIIDDNDSSNDTIINY